MKYGKYLLLFAERNREYIPTEAYVDYKRLKKALHRDPESFMALWADELFRVRDFLEQEMEEYKEYCNCTAGFGWYMSCICKRRVRIPPLRLRALSQFVAVNREGFRKVMKKHDKRRGTNQQAHSILHVERVLRDPVSQLENLVDLLTPKAAVPTKWMYLVLPALGLAIILFSVLIPAVFADSRLETLFQFGVAASFFLAFANGANDISNSVGTLVGAQALTLKQAVILGCIFEFAGAMTMGASVSKTISKGVIEPANYAGPVDSGPTLFALAMLCVVVAAGLTTFLATAYGFPISATHSIIGGLVAVGWATKGAHSIGWTTLGFTALSWVASPVVGMLASGAIYFVVLKVIVNSDDPARNSRRYQPFFLGFTVFVLVLFLLMKGPQELRVDPMWAAVLLSIGLAVFIALAFLLYGRWRATRNPKEEDVVPHFADQVELQQKDSAAVCVDVKEEKEKSEEKSEEEKIEEDGEEAAKLTAASPSVESEEEEEGTPTDESQFAKPVPVKIARAEKPFVVLLILSGLIVAFAHGGNDVGNSVGPLEVISQINEDHVVAEKPKIHYSSLALGAVGFVIGILIMGSRTIKTVGTRITRLTPSKSYATQIGAAIAVMGSSALGMPVSTSHCLVGSVVGISIAQHLVTVSEQDGINMGILKKIFAAWGLTIPLAMIVALLLLWPLMGTEFDYTT